MIAEITNIFLETFQGWGYGGIFILMVIESSFIPFPSEVVMIPAGYLASIWKMNIFLAFLAGTTGALVGALINYFLWKKLGAKIVHDLIEKYGKYIFLRIAHYHKSEEFFRKHGAITTFHGRLLPWIRQLISIPAWIFHMNLMQFIFYTFLGAWIWNIILLSIGYIAWENQKLIKEYLSEITIGIMIFIVGATIFYIFYQKRRLN